MRIDFAEREQFFMMLWNENINYYRSFLNEFDNAKIKMLSEAEQENNKVHQFY